MAEREYKIDTLKGALIILVVLGHLIGPDSSDVINSHCWTFIYTFHMPLFILLSGYFFRIKANEQFWKGILDLAIPLCVFQVLNLLAIVIVGGCIKPMMLITPYWTLWYLLSLIFWRVLLQFSPRWLSNNPWFYIVIAIIASLLCGLLPYGRIMSLQRTINFYPFFLFGYYLRQEKMPPILSAFGNVFVSAIVIGLVVILIAFDVYPANQSVLLRGADHYGLDQIPAKLFLLVSSFAVSFSLFNVTNLVKKNIYLTNV